MQKTVQSTGKAGIDVPLDQSTKSLVTRLLRNYLRPHAWRIAAALLCMVVVAISTAAFTQLMKPIINDIFVARNADLLIPVAAMALIVFVAKGLATYGQAVIMSYVGFRIVADIQGQLYRRLIGADLAFFHQTAPGELVARFINDVNKMRNAVSDTLTGLGKDSLTALALIVVMFYEDWLLAAVAFVAFPTAILPIVKIGRRMRKVSGNTQAQIGKLTTLLDETFQGVRHVKAYAMEAYEAERTQTTVDRVFQLNFKGARTRNLSHPIMETLGGLAIVAVILYGGSQVISGTKDAGSFFAFITALLLAYEPMKRLARLNANLQEGLAAAARVFELMDRPPNIQERADAKPLTLSGGEVTFKGVSFSYDGAKSALHQANLAVPAGQTIALVGPSGSGKSTILNLIPRFYDVQEGEVQIDGTDVRDVTFDSLRGAIALVSQEILLFDDTVRANIAYGRLDASEEDILNAARLSGSHDFIEAMPEGYETQVGPRGSNLSGGQRQRIAIARAMLKNAPILLLDEATSALDNESERQVQAALKDLMAGRTTLVIAHRLSTVVDADRIYVIEEGRVVDQGQHSELMARGGTYARLYASQFADQEGQPDRDPTDSLRHASA